MNWGAIIMWSWLFFFVFGFTFMVCVGMWAVVTITRMKQEQVQAISMLEALVQHAELKKHIVKLQQS